MINGYHIEDEVGAGGFGVVYRARQSSTFDREVAIKVIQPRYANEPDFIRRFESEAQLIARLEHAHIVPLYDYWRDPNGAYLVMRWMRGGSLKNALKQQPLNVETVGQTVTQICASLAVAHQQGVIHRDIKPSNILLDEYGNAYLADFGIAKDLMVFSSTTQPDAIIGSPGYLAPEQARSEVVSPRTDVYSLGVTIYELLAGKHPFDEVNDIEKLYKHLNEPLPYLRGLDPNVEAQINEVIQKATAKNPIERYATSIEFASAFHEAAKLGQPSTENIVTSLSIREQEILQGIIDGKSNKEIVNQFFISVNTVRWYLRQIYKKLNVRSRVQAVVKARELNLIVSSDTPDTDDSQSLMTYVVVSEPENPYKGLKAFTAADTMDFFGREKLTQKLLARLQEDHESKRFLAVIGPSGSGKSSLVKAGLVPAIWRGDIPDSDNWYVVEMMPSTHPLDELEIALTRVAADQGQNLMEHLQRDERGLVRVGQLILPDDDSELLIVIDQFEEIFTLVEDEARRDHFLNLISTAVADPRSRIRVVVTLRADFYDRPLQYPNFGEMLRNRMETILPLSAEELENAIVQPAKRVGVKFADGLVSMIVSDVNYQPGSLPLLQYALTELFEGREGRIITREAYQKIGGTVGALARRANNLYEELDDGGQELIRQIMLRLVTLGEGTEDTRRRTPRAELLALSDDVDLIDDIIDTFASYRLLALDHDPTTRQPTVEVAHEAILREWEQLRLWLNDNRDDIKTQRQLSTLAIAWDANNHDESYLVRGTRLEQFQLWSLSTKLSLTPTEMDYLSATINAYEHRKAEKQAQVECERKLELRARKVLQGLVAVLLAAAVVAIGLALFAFGERSTAQEERDRAEVAEKEALLQASVGLAAQSQAELNNGNFDRAVLVALEALENYPYTSQAESALADAVVNYVPRTEYLDFQMDTAAMSNVRWSPNGHYLAVISGAGSIEVRELVVNETVFAFTPENIAAVESTNLAWSYDSTILSTSHGDTNTGWIVQFTNVSANEVFGQQIFEDEVVTGLDWSPDDTEIVMSFMSGNIALLSRHGDSQPIVLSSYEHSLTDVKWSPNGAEILTSSHDSTAQIWDAQTSELKFRLSGHADSVNSVAWSPQGLFVATGSSDQTVRVWNSQTGALMYSLAGHDGNVAHLEWSPNGKYISVATDDGVVTIWDIQLRKIFLIISNQATIFPYVTWSPDSTQFATLKSLGFAIWNLPNSPFSLSGHANEQYDASWSPDGSRILTSGWDDRTAKIWDAHSGDELLTFVGHENGIGFVDWSPDGERVVTTSTDMTARVWDAETGDQLVTVSYHDEPTWPWFVAWSPDGSRVVTSNSSGARVWDANTGETISTFFTTCWPDKPSWSPDSMYVVSGCMGLAPEHVNSHVAVWNADTGQLLQSFEQHGDYPWAVDWSPDGTRIVSGANDGTVFVWDPHTGDAAIEFIGHTNLVSDIAWSPDSTRIASGDILGNVLIWNPEDGAEVMRFKVANSVWDLEWSLDGDVLMVTDNIGTNTPSFHRVWQSTQALIDYAKECCVTRELTPAEREQFGLPPRDD